MSTSLEAASEKLAVALLLTSTGGFLDAFTFVGHGKVFANSMTGNVVELGIELASGDWASATKHLAPLIGFACAVLITRVLCLAVSRPTTAAVLSLVFEVAFLAWAAWIRLPEFWLIPGISYFETQQAIFFTQAGHVTYSSVMTTGNLRGALQRLFESTIPRLKPAGLHEAGALGTISVSFALGAVLGGMSTPRLHDDALFVPVALLAGALALILAQARAPGREGISGAASRR
ncbi:MAG: DUF1275 domain-containing protein [Paraburkholderia sp.]|nr:DUF1275 domain-containing protein [Paraburkholderia sp.]